MATIKDIAKQAGVSISTVSYALNGTGNIRPETQERIRRIACEMNYIPNINAKLLKVRQTKTVGLFLSFFSGSFFLYLTESICQSLSMRDYDLQLHIAKEGGESLISKILSANVDAAILLHYHLSEQDAKRLNRTMADNHMPLVYLDRETVDDKTSCIVTENGKGIEQVVQYLAETGHRRIAYLRGEDCYDDIKRYEAYLSAMKRLGLEVRPYWQFNATEFTEWAGYQFMKSVLPTLSDMPDAICCANDCLAVGCIKALQSFGYTVPQDVSVTGYDNLIPAMLSDIPLTTVQYPVVRMGQMAVNEVFRLMEPEQTGKLLWAESTFIKKDSTAIRGKVESK